MDNGWIRIDKELFEIGGWNDNRFDRFHAWIDILLLVSPVSRNLRIRGINIQLGPGDAAISLRDLAKRWAWSVNTVRGYLREMELMCKISIRKSNVISIIHVNEWQKYIQLKTQTDTQIDTQTDTQTDTQNFTSNISHSEQVATSENRSADTQTDTQIDTQTDTQTDTQKPKGKGRKFAPPNVDEIRAYIAQQNYTFDAESFYDFYQSKGWMVGKNKMKDWKAAARNWQRMEKQRRTGSYGIKQEQYDRRRATEVTANGPEDYEGRFI